MGQASFVFLNNVDQFPEDGELELKLDAVHKSFDGLLEDVQVFVLDGEEGNLQKSARLHEREEEKRTSRMMMTILMVNSCHITLRTPSLEMTLSSLAVFHRYSPLMMNSCMQNPVI